MAQFFADVQFGPDPTAQQPTDTAVPTHLGRPEPVAKTVHIDQAGLKHSPALATVVLLGLAMVLLNWVSK